MSHCLLTMLNPQAFHPLKNLCLSCVGMCTGMRLPYSLELEFCEAVSCPVWVRGTEPCLQPTRCLLPLRHQQVLWTPHITGNTCSQIPVCWLFFEGGKTWHMWVLPADCAPGTPCYSEFESKLKARCHVVSRLERSQGRPPHSRCWH